MKKSTDEALEITKATPTVLSALMALYEQLSGDNAPIEPDAAAQSLSAFHGIAGSGLFVGHIADKLICTCALAVIPNLTRSGRPYGLIENVVTHCDYRGLGYGKQILSHAINHAWGQGCYKVMLFDRITEA